MKFSKWFIKVLAIWSIAVLCLIGMFACRGEDKANSKLYVETKNSSDNSDRGGSKQRYCEESDFRVRPLDGGKSMEIIRYVGNKQVVRIPPRLQKVPVTAIGTDAFRGKEIISVSIPNSVTVIGDSAFAQNQLINVTIPNGVTTIGSVAFAVNQLANVNIPSSVTEIGAGAFWGNPLTNFSIASGNTKYSAKDLFLLNKNGTEIIEYLGNQKNITIPNGVIAIEDNLFYDFQLTSVTIPNSVITIGKNAFAKNRLTSVTIPSSVRKIELRAFYDNQLTNVTISNGVTTIEALAFYKNRLTSVNIPNSVEKIGNNSPFSGNPITSITIGANVNIVASEYGGCGFAHGFADFYVYDDMWQRPPVRRSGAYSQNNRAAGTYIRNNVGVWSYRKIVDVQPSSTETFTNRIVRSPSTGVLNIRSGPSADFDIIFVLQNNDVVKVSNQGQSGDWVKVRFDNIEGFVNQRFLTNKL